MTWATHGPLREEMVAARADFFRQSGEVHDDEPSYDAFMDAFVDWYLFDRPMAAFGTPAQRFLKEQGGVMAPDELRPFDAFQRTRPGLFRLESLREGEVRVKDLATRERIVVVERRKMVGVDKGDIFHARLIPMEDGQYFTGMPLFHPSSVRRQVMKVANHARRQGTPAFAEACRNLMLRRLKVDRYKRVAPPTLYADMVPKGLVPFW
jgi:hypothetical protein